VEVWTKKKPSKEGGVNQNNPLFYEKQRIELKNKSMKLIFMKPDLTIYFAAMPLIGIWLKSDYDKANTAEDLINLMHKWFNEAERTDNTTRAHAHQSVAQYLYTLLTGKSFESKGLETLINEFNNN